MPHTHIHKLLLALSCALTVAACKGQQIFQKTYTVPGYYSYGVSIAKAPLGQFMVLSGIHNIIGPFSQKALLMRTDPDGTSLWAKQYQVSGTMNDWAAHITHAGNDRYLMTLNQNFPDSSSVGYNAASVSLIDSAGNMVWTTALHDTTKQVDYTLKKTLRIGNANYSVGTTNIAFYVNPYTDTTKLGLVVKTDTLGNLQWAKNYGTYATIFNDMVSTDDGGMVIIGTTETSVPIGQYIKDLIYLKLDSAGDVLWSNKWNWPTGGNGYCIAKATNGFLLGGVHIPIINENAFILKIDNYGNLKWGNYYNGIGSSAIRIHNIMEHNGKILFSFGYGVIIADSSGNNFVRYFDQFFHSMAAVIKTNDNGYAQTGSVNNCYIIKHDSIMTACNTGSATGVAFPLNISVSNNPLVIQNINLFNTTLGFSKSSITLADSIYCQTATSIAKGEIENTITVFPNPFTQHINVNIAEIKLSAVRVLDVLGNAVAFSQNNNGNTLTLQFDDFKSGIYILQLTDTHGHTHTKKIACVTTH